MIGAGSGLRLFRSLQILEIVAHCIDILPVRLRIAVWQKMLIAVVRGLKSTRMLDRAPVLLSSSRNFRDVRQYSVPIRAVQTIKAFECIQISQLIAVNRDVVFTPHFRNAINGKTNGLVNGNEKIEHRERNDACVYEWRT